jgi:hypothetical protein
LLSCFSVVFSNTSTKVQTFFTAIAQPPADDTKYDTAVRPKLVQDDDLEVTINIGITAIKDFFEEAAVCQSSFSNKHRHQVSKQQVQMYDQLELDPRQN